MSLPEDKQFQIFSSIISTLLCLKRMRDELHFLDFPPKSAKDPEFQLKQKNFTHSKYFVGVTMLCFSLRAKMSCHVMQCFFSLVLCYPKGIRCAIHFLHEENAVNSNCSKGVIQS